MVTYEVRANYGGRTDGRGGIGGRKRIGLDADFQTYGDALRYAIDANFRYGGADAKVIKVNDGG